MINVPEAPEEALCNCLAIRQAARQITQLYDTELASTGLRTTQYTLLSRLARTGPISLQALAEALVMDRSTLSHNLGPLERDRLVTLGVDREDRRARKLSLTATGTARLRAARSAWQRAQQRFDARYGKRDAAALRRLMRRAVEAART
jgi:DNA-binding MarR family transcriptional regulator